MTKKTTVKMTCPKHGVICEGGSKEGFSFTFDGKKDVFCMRCLRDKCLEILPQVKVEVVDGK